jgi:hypothetical protein
VFGDVLAIFGDDLAFNSSPINLRNRSRFVPGVPWASKWTSFAACSGLLAWPAASAFKAFWTSGSSLENLSLLRINSGGGGSD